MLLPWLGIVVMGIAVAIALRALDTELTEGELVRREIVPVLGDLCLTRGLYRYRVDGRVHEQLIWGRLARRSDEAEMRAAIRALAATRRLRADPDAPEVRVRADGVAVPVVVRAR